MPSQPKLPFLTLALALTLLPFPPARANPHTPTRPHAPTVDRIEWQPNPKLLAKLGLPRPFGPYTLRLPPGFAVTPAAKPAPGQAPTAFQITGPARPDGTFPGLLLFLGAAPPGINTPPAAIVLDDNNVLRIKPNLTLSEKQTGHTAYLQFVREYFKWRDLLPSARTTHGFQYAASDGATYILVMAFDTEPHSVNTLPLLEAAILTLRKTH